MHISLRGRPASVGRRLRMLRVILGELTAFMATVLFAAASAQTSGGAAPPDTVAPAPPTAGSSQPAPAAPAGSTAATDTLNELVLSGVWVLDEKASQDPRPAFEAVLAEIGFGEPGTGGARGPEGAGGRGDRGGRGVFGSGDGQDRRDPNWRGVGDHGRPDGTDRGGPGGDAGGDWGNTGGAGGGASFGSDKDVDPAQRRAAVAARMGDAWQRLLISHAGADLEIMDAGDQTNAYVVDGKWHERRGRAGSSNVNARRQGDAVVIMIQQKGRFGMTETYQLDPKERRLDVTLRLEPPSGADRLVRLVYGPPQ